MRDTTPDEAPPLTYAVRAHRVDAHHSIVECKQAALTVDTDLAGRVDAFNPAELLLAALSACMLKGIERVMPMLHFDLRSVAISMHGVRQDLPPKFASIRYEIDLDTDESEQRIALLHANVQKYGTVFNTVAPGTDLQGTMRRIVVAVV
jgi:uncharacterized OsmC-like protein